MKTIILSLSLFTAFAPSTGHMLKTLSLSILIFLLLSIRCEAQAVSIENASVIEGLGIQLRLTLNTAVTDGFTINFSTQGQTAQGDGVDFNSTVPSVTFTGSAPETQVVTISTNDDQIAEGNETFVVAMYTEKQGVDVSATAIATIVDNDIARIAIKNVKVNEGDDLVFKLKLDKAVQKSFTVNATLADGTAITRPTSGTKRERRIGDYHALARSVVFDGTANEEHEFVVHSLVDFFPNEGDEFFTVSLATEPTLTYLEASASARGIISDFTDCLNCPSVVFLDTVEQLNLTFYGDGNLQRTVQSGDDLAATTGIGVHMDKYFKHFPRQKFGPWYRAELMAQINIASSVDTVLAERESTPGIDRIKNISSFGNAVLTPLNSGQAVDLKLRLYNKKPIGGIISGFEFRYIGSNRNWKLSADTLGQINTNLARIIIFHDLIPYFKRNNYSVMLRAGYAANWMRGDLGSRQFDDIRKTFVGTSRRTFHGVEFGVGFRLKNILADFAYTILPGEENVAGLTGSRLVMTIKFVGGFKIALE